MAKKKWILSLTAVDEAQLENAGLPPNSELGSLPDRIDEAMTRVAPGALDLESVFLLNDAQKEQLEEYLQENSLPYHAYAVDERGEQCRKGSACVDHATKCVVLCMNDHIRRRQEDPVPDPRG